MDDETSTLTVLVMLTIFSVLGTIGNSLVLYIYHSKKEKSTAGIFIMSLAGTDLVTCLLIVPYTEAAIYLQYYLNYDAACKIYMFLITCNVPFAAFIMVAIAVDRFFCICHPFLHALNIQRAKIIVICLLVLASVFGVITALIHGVYVYAPVPTLPQSDNTTVVETGYQIANSDIGNSSITCAGSKLCHVLLNTSSVTESPSNASEVSYQLQYIGLCMPNFILIGANFASVYQKVYAGFYLLSFIAVCILYGLIYRSIHAHRAKRSKRKRSSLYPTVADFSMVESQFTAVTHVNPHKKNGDTHPQLPPEAMPMTKSRNRNKSISIKEKTLMANIRTAAMLFVVTLVFTIAFLPAWLMAHNIVEFNQIIFYMYFVYNTANPFIYAFMNKSFRDDLRKVVKRLTIRSY